MKKKNENEFKSLSVPLPKGTGYSRIQKLDWTSLNLRDSHNTGELSYEKNISSNEAPLLTPSQKRELYKAYGNTKPISIFGFDDFLIIIYEKREYLDGISSVNDAVLLDIIKDENTVYTGVLQEKKSDGKYRDGLGNDVRRSVTSFNVQLSTDGGMLKFAQKLLIYPDKKMINIYKGGYFKTPDVKKQQYKTYYTYNAETDTYTKFEGSSFVAGTSYYEPYKVVTNDTAPKRAMYYNSKSGNITCIGNSGESSGMGKTINPYEQNTDTDSQYIPIRTVTSDIYPKPYKVYFYKATPGDTFHLFKGHYFKPDYTYYESYQFEEADTYPSGERYMTYRNYRFGNPGFYDWNAAISDRYPVWKYCFYEASEVQNHIVDIPNNEKNKQIQVKDYYTFENGSYKLMEKWDFESVNEIYFEDLDNDDIYVELFDSVFEGEIKEYSNTSVGSGTIMYPPTGANIGNSYTTVQKYPDWWKNMYYCAPDHSSANYGKCYVWSNTQSNAEPHIANNISPSSLSWVETSLNNTDGVMPKLNYVTTHLSRVFGVDDYNIYASGFNDFTDWDLDTAEEYNPSNAWMSALQANTKSSGKITGLYSFQNHIIVFKEDYMHEITNNKNPFRVADIYGDGTFDIRSVQEVNGSLFFVSRDGVKQYTGGNPKNIGFNLNIDNYDEAISGSDGRRYYLYCKSDNKKHLFVYDTYFKRWSEEEVNENIIGFAKTSKGFFCLTDSYTVGSQDFGPRIMKIDTGSYDHDWVFETDFSTRSTSSKASYSNVEIKHLRKINLLADIRAGSSFKVYIIYDNDKSNDGGAEKNLVYDSGISNGDRDNMPIRILLRKTANFGFKVRFEGHGYVRIHEMEIRQNQDSDTFKYIK